MVFFMFPKLIWLLVLISSIILSIFETGMYSGSWPLKPNITAKSVACPFPVSESEPYKSIFIRQVSEIMFFLVTLW